MKHGLQSIISETEVLKDYISKNNLLFPVVAIENYVSEGSEQKVYLKDGRNLIKLNDAIFYESWEDYLYSLLLHFAVYCVLLATILSHPPTDGCDKKENCL